MKLETSLNRNTKPTLDSIAYVEMYVGNIFQAKNFFVNSLKFTHVATKTSDKTVTLLMKQGDIHFLLSGSLEEDTPIAAHIHHYGDCIKKIAFWVQDAAACFEASIRGGVEALQNPHQKDGVIQAAVEMFNKVEHVFLEKSEKTRELKIPGFEYSTQNLPQNPMVFNIDHIATCHPKDGIKRWVKFYKEAFSFKENTNEDIYSEESGMHITIMVSPNGQVQLPLVEPNSDKSPLNKYLQYNHGAGVHHIALETNDIIDAVQYFENHAGELRKAPPHYYDELKKVYSSQVNNLDRMAPFGIMMEEDEKGILFQIFTKPVVTRPTFFLEFLQREKCEGFGTVNIKTLYESLEA